MENLTFEQAILESKKLSERPSNDTLLKIYSLYKQAIEGDVTGDRPGGFDFKGGAKYDAWTSVKGKNKEDAKNEYVSLISSLVK